MKDIEKGINIPTKINVLNILSLNITLSILNNKYFILLITSKLLS
jgi:hypothetical protein